MAQAPRVAGGQGAAQARKVFEAGLDLLKKGETQEARDIFARILERNPETAAAHLAMGRAFFQEGDYHKALEHFQEAMNLDGNVAAQALFFSANAHERLGDRERAVEEYEEATEMDPTFGRAQLRLSQMFVRDEEYDEAIRRLQDGLRYNPQDYSARLVLAGIHQQKGDTAAAAAELEKAIETKPDLAVAYRRLGRIRLTDKVYPEARRLLEKALELSPDKASSHFALGMAFEGLGQYDKALDAYAEAERLNPKRSAAEIQRAAVLIKLKRYDDALQSLQSVVKSKPDLAAAHKQLGDVYYHLKKYGLALEEYRAALLNQPDLAEKHPELKRIEDIEAATEETVSKAFQSFQAVADEISFRTGEAKGALRRGVAQRVAARRGGGMAGALKG